MCAFLFWMKHCGIWNRCIHGICELGQRKIGHLLMKSNCTWSSTGLQIFNYMVKIGYQVSIPSNGCRGTLQWSHNGRDGVSDYQPHDCLLNRLFRGRSKKTSKLRVTGLCAGNSPGTGEFPAQMASNAKNVSIWWRHHVDFQGLWFTWKWVTDNYICVYFSLASTNLLLSLVCAPNAPVHHWVETKWPFYSTHSLSKQIKLQNMNLNLQTSYNTTHNDYHLHIFASILPLELS